MSRPTPTSAGWPAHAEAIFDEWGLAELKTGAAAADTDVERGFIYSSRKIN